MSRRRPKRRADQTGRSAGERFVQLPHFLLNSEAYRSLSLGARALLVEILKRYNGSNNGCIALGQREASEALGASSREAIAKYFRELEATGFIIATRRSGFNLKAPEDRRASEWMVTLHRRGDEPASKAFMAWRPSKIHGAEKLSVKDRKAVPELNGKHVLEALKGGNPVGAGPELDASKGGKADHL